MSPPTEPPKSRAQIKREIDEVLARKPGGALAPHQGRWDDSPGAWQRGYEFAQEAALHETRAEQREILQRVAAGARSAYDHGFMAGYQDMLGDPRLKINPQHSSIAKEQTSSDAPSLRVGQQFDHFGHIYEITKIGRDKNRTVQIARRQRDPFGKEAFIDHRSFPARHFDQQQLRLIATHSTIKASDAPRSVAHVVSDREIAEALGAKPINSRKIVRHFSEWKDKIGRVHLAVTYEDLSSHAITPDELQRYRERESRGDVPRERRYR